MSNPLLPADRIEVTCDNNAIYSLSPEAYEALERTSNSAQAERIFNEFAPHVPRSDRVRVWYAIDDSWNVVHIYE